MRPASTGTISDRRMAAGSRPTARQCVSSTRHLAAYSSGVTRVTFHSSACSATILSVRRSPRPPTMSGTPPPGGTGNDCASRSG
ncbi:MAG TPA: hypothetical protein VFV05_00445 [Methylomirabilota bacterium]|nr:hypothetical protein [Methylomirabilota bacterium]